MELSRQQIFSLLPKRSKDANKGTFGKVLVIAGSDNFPGAAYLACAAIYRVGAGLVTLVSSKEVKTIVARKLPEVTFLSRSEVFEKLSQYNVLLIGPGLGQAAETVKFIKQILEEKLPSTVMDGDGLNILSKMDGWWNKVKTEIILTPHPGEMSRLTDLSIEEIQSNRENIARHFAKKWHQAVVLKGANTVVVSPAGEAAISPFANPALATAGTGDVLSGIIAGFIAQGLSIFDAACAAVYIHGLTAEMIKKKMGDAGVIASDLLPLLPRIITKLI